MFQWNSNQNTVEPLWKGQNCLTKVVKFGPFPCTIFYKSCLFYPSWQATSFERPPSWVAFIEGFHCTTIFVEEIEFDNVIANWQPLCLSLSVLIIAKVLYTIKIMNHMSKIITFCSWLQQLNQKDLHAFIFNFFCVCYRCYELCNSWISSNWLSKILFKSPRGLWVNSSPPSAAYMCQWTGSALVQVMACRLFGAKLLPEPKLVYCQLDSREQISVKFESEFYYFHSIKCIWNCRLPKWRPFCPGGDELIMKVYVVEVIHSVWCLNWLFFSSFTRPWTQPSHRNVCHTCSWRAFVNILWCTNAFSWVKSWQIINL